MKLQTFLRWIMRFVLPATGWRVPVVLLHGTARGSGREVVLLCAGRGEAFITPRFFAGEPAVLRSTHTPVWRLQRLLEEWRSDADLVVVAIDRLSARLLPGPQYLAVPRWICSWMDVPQDLQAFARIHSSTQTDVRRVRIKNFECHFSRKPEDFDLFYDQFYVPYVSARHGGLAQITPRRMLRYVFNQGEILWVTHQGQRVSGKLFTVGGSQMLGYVNGLLNGREDLLKAGAIGALYVHSVLEARRRGLAEFNMGGSLPSLHDGVLRYKSKWANSLRAAQASVAANCVTLLGWNRMAGPVAEFLSHTSIIHHDQDGFSALWAFPHDQPLTAATLQQHYNHLKTRGLRRFDILLPGEAPAGFVCPPEVRLIPWGALNLDGPELLAVLTPGQIQPQSP